MSKEIWRCAVCNFETPPINAPGCPNCDNTINIPYTSKNDVTIKINTLELRILTYWAEYWVDYMAKNELDGADRSRKVLRNIITRLKPQLPDNTPLTFSADFGMLKKEYPGAETNFGVDEEQL